MNWNEVKEQWPSVQQSIKRTWGRIDEADLEMIQGRRDSFIRIFAQRYDQSEAVAQTKVDDFIERLQPEDRRQVGQYWFSGGIQKFWRHIHVASRH